MIISCDYVDTIGNPMADKGYTLLAERSVNIYSDMGDTVYEGDVITMRGDLIGFVGKDVTLQWQYDNGWSWTDVPGANQLTHSFIATQETINYSWRLNVKVNN